MPSASLGHDASLSFVVRGRGQEADSTEMEKRKLMEIPNYKSQITNKSQ
jgi:hypothetical protein